MAERMQNHSGAESAVRTCAGGLFCFSIFLMLVLAFRVDNPLVIYDELAYLIFGKDLNNVAMVHELAPSVPQTNNILYLRSLNLIYKFGIPVDTGAKLLNVLSIGIANWILVQRILAHDRRPAALLPIALVCFFPTISYAAYVMPDAVYFAGFVIVCTKFFSDFDPCSITKMLPVVFFLAALALIKPHAIMIFTSLIGSLTVFCACFDRARAKQYFISIMILTAAFSITTPALKWILTPASTAGYDVVGTFYWRMILQSVPNFERISEFLSTLTRYLPWLGTMYTPLLVLGIGEIARRRPLALAPNQRNIVLFILFLLVSLFIVMIVAVYLISFETDRVHFRYFGFIFPVFVTLIWISRRDHQKPSPRAAVVAAGLWLVSIAAAGLSFSHYRPLAVDAPELFAFYGQQEFGAFAPRGLRVALLFFLAAMALSTLVRQFRLVDIQVAALCVISAVSLWNVVGSQTAMTNSPALSGFRRIGSVAALLCGKGYDGVILIGQSNVYVPLAYALYKLGQASRFMIVAPDQVSNAIERAPASTCLLTTFEVPDRKAVLLFAVPALWLYRTNG